MDDVMVPGRRVYALRDLYVTSGSEPRISFDVRVATVLSDTVEGRPTIRTEWGGLWVVDAREMEGSRRWCATREECVQLAAAQLEQMFAGFRERLAEFAVEQMNRSVAERQIVTAA
jgi:hypothetical protein